MSDTVNLTDLLATLIGPPRTAALYGPLDLERALAAEVVEAIFAAVEDDGPILLDRNGDMTALEQIDCRDCNGEGSWLDRLSGVVFPCEVCGGSGSLHRKAGMT